MAPPSLAPLYKIMMRGVVEVGGVGMVKARNKKKWVKKDCGYKMFRNLIKNNNIIRDFYL